MEIHDKSKLFVVFVTFLVLFANISSGENGKFALILPCIFVIYFKYSRGKSVLSVIFQYVLSM